MTSVRKYISTIDEGGRLRIVRSDGQEITELEKTWFDNLVTTELRNEKTHAAAMRRVQYKESKGNTHPLMLTFGLIARNQGMNLTQLSYALSKRRSAVSEWLRGNAKPQLEEAYALFGMAGYKLMAVPNTIVDQVRNAVLSEEARVAQIDKKISMGDETDGEVHGSSRSA